MLTLLPILIPIALVDSLSMTPMALVLLIKILAGNKPYTTAVGFLSGLFISYLVMALAFLFGLSAFLHQANAWVSHRWSNPEPMDFAVEIILGVVLLAFGFPIAKKREKKSGQKNPPQKMTPGSAFSFGFMVNVVGFPGAVPYFAAADQIAKANVGTQGMTLAVIFYVLMFVLPLSALLVVRRLLGAKLDGFMLGCQKFFDTTGPRMVKISMVLLGLLMVADGVAFFLGNPLLPIGF